MVGKSKQLDAAISEAVVSELSGKKWYVSKTFWANILAGLTVTAQMKYGFLIDPSYQMLGMTLVNIILRKITKEEVVW